MRDRKQIIEEILTTLYETDAHGYHGIDRVTLNTEAKKRLQRALSTLDAKTRHPVEDEANYRLERFGKFKELPVDQRSEILKIARQKQIPVEKAYELSGAARN